MVLQEPALEESWARWGGPDRQTDRHGRRLSSSCGTRAMSAVGSQSPALLPVPGGTPTCASPTRCGAGWEQGGSRRGPPPCTPPSPSPTPRGAFLLSRVVAGDGKQPGGKVQGWAAGGSHLTPRGAPSTPLPRDATPGDPPGTGTTAWGTALHKGTGRLHAARHRGRVPGRPRGDTRRCPCPPRTDGLRGSREPPPPAQLPAGSGR